MKILLDAASEEMKHGFCAATHAHFGRKEIFVISSEIFMYVYLQLEIYLQVVLFQKKI